MDSFGMVMLFFTHELKINQMTVSELNSISNELFEFKVKYSSGSSDDDVET